MKISITLDFLLVVGWVGRCVGHREGDVTGDEVLGESLEELERKWGFDVSFFRFSFPPLLSFCFFFPSSSSSSFLLKKISI